MDKLTKFRNHLYSNFPVRADATMNLLDAISSHGHIARSVVQLSEAPSFKRRYSSVTDAISNGLTAVNWDGAEQLLFKTCFDETVGTPPCFLLDCTPNPRPFAKTLEDKTIVHAPNPAPGNRPICVGHSYSCIALLPIDRDARAKKWLVPLSALRVRSDVKGNEEGMRQLLGLIEKFDLKHHLTMSVGDSLYGSEACRALADSSENLVHIFRVNSKRNLYAQPDIKALEPGRRGRKKEYGHKMSLADPKTHIEPTTSSAQTGFMSRSGNIYNVQIEAWDNMLMKGSRTHRGSKHPMTLLRVKVTDSKGTLIFKRPLWLAACGKLRAQVSLNSIYQYYRARYDIEHFFRFGKSKLLIDAYQTADVNHEENWSRLCLLAYGQLYLAKSLVAQRPKPWEKYLPSYRQQSHTRAICSPAQAQRGFSVLLDVIGTPAKLCTARGITSGRKSGYKVGKRPERQVVYKTQAAFKTFKKLISPGVEQAKNSPNLKEIRRLIKTVVTTLKKFQFDTEKFTELLSKSK